MSMSTWFTFLREKVKSISVYLKGKTTENGNLKLTFLSENEIPVRSTSKNYLFFGPLVVEILHTWAARKTIFIYGISTVL